MEHKEERQIVRATVSFVITDAYSVQFATCDADVAFEMATTINRLLLENELKKLGVDSDYESYLSSFFEMYLQLDDTDLDFEIEHDCPIEEVFALADKHLEDYNIEMDVSDIHADIERIISNLKGEGILSVFTCAIDVEVLRRITKLYDFYPDYSEGGAYPDGYVISFYSDNAMHYLSDNHVYRVDKDGNHSFATRQIVKQLLFLVYERGLTREMDHDTRIIIHKLGKEGISCSAIRHACAEYLTPEYADMDMDKLMLNFLRDEYSHIEYIHDYYEDKYFNLRAREEADTYWMHEDEEPRYSMSDNSYDSDDIEEPIDDEAAIDALYKRELEEEQKYYDADKDDLTSKYEGA